MYDNISKKIYNVGFESRKKNQQQQNVYIIYII